MWWRARASAAAAAAVVVVVAVSGCGFQPLFQGGMAPGTTAENLSQVEVASIEHRTGQKLRNALIDQLQARGGTARPRYRLDVTLTESIQQLAVKKTEFATRANLNMTATFTLIDLRSRPQSNAFAGTVRAVSSYNRLQSDYATLVAEDHARTRAAQQLANAIRARLMVFLTRDNPAENSGTGGGS